MGRDLYQHSPVFAAAFDEVIAALDAHLDRAIKDLIFAQPDTPKRTSSIRPSTPSPRSSPSKSRSTDSQNPSAYVRTI